MHTFCTERFLAVHWIFEISLVSRSVFSFDTPRSFAASILFVPFRTTLSLIHHEISCDIARISFPILVFFRGWTPFVLVVCHLMILCINIDWIHWIYIITSLALRWIASFLSGISNVVLIQLHPLRIDKFWRLLRSLSWTITCLIRLSLF